MTDCDFTNKTAVVTGGNGGLGTAIGRALWQRGANVILVDRDPAVHETASSIDPASQRVVGFEADVTNSEQLAGAVALAERRFGGLQLAVNNAGIVLPLMGIVKLSDEQWRGVIDVNLNGVFYGMKHQIQSMLKGGQGGAIVNTASALGLVAVPNAAAYIASKHGVIGLTKAAALECAPRGHPN